VISLLAVHQGGGVGGAPVSLLKLLGGLDRSEFAARALFTERGDIVQYARELDVDARVVPMGGAFFYSAHAQLEPRGIARFLRTFPSAVQTALRALRQHRPDVLHLNTSVLLAWAAAAVTCRDRDILLPVYAIGNRAGLNGTAERRFPKNLSAVGIECSELLIQIAPENQSAGGCEYGSGGWHFPIHPTLDFACGEIHLRQTIASERRIHTRARSSHTTLRRTTLPVYSFAFCGLIQTVVDERNIKRVRKIG